MKRALVLALALTSTLTACGGDNGQDAVGQGSTSSCPRGTGTTDLTTKPAVTVPDGAEPTETTLIDIVTGTGAEAKAGSNVAVKYVGALYKDCSEFDSSWSRGATDTLPFQIGGGVIEGFSKGTTGMRVGGRREVIIPSKDGYGPMGSGSIPPNATLIFVIDLVTVS